jgi:crotonobetainyl-CoA:carnitine CoA-transferase CaiB-like acyl-CoA transferase
MMGIQNDREWRTFCARFLGDPDLAVRPAYATNAARSQHRDELGAVIAERFAAMTGDEATGILAAIPIAYARVNSMREVWEHPQLVARGRWHRVRTPTGELPSLAPPGFTATEPRMDPVPALGEHSRSILEEIGLSSDEVDALVADGVV